MRKRTILNPALQARPNYRPLSERDYILVDVLSTYGTWSVWEMLAVESKGALARWANAMESRDRRRVESSVADLALRD